MSEAAAFESLLKRDRVITIGALIVLSLLAWLYVLTGAGLGMGAAEMTNLALFPHQRQAMAGMHMGAAAVAPAAWSAGAWTLTIAMWWTMMIAMMTPSAAPAILLYARVHRHASALDQAQRLAPTGAFAAGYLLVWLGFSLAAAALHWALEYVGLLWPMAMGSQSRWLSAAVLTGAGLYQLSPLKGVCLAHCRAPAAFLARHWRPGAGGALRLGAMHGVYCLGCCWLLMVLLFIGGVMNLAWIAALAILVLAEKAFPAGPRIGRGAGVILICWGVATLLV